MLIETSRDFQIPRARVLAHVRDPERMETVLRDAGVSLARVAEPPEPAWEGEAVWKHGAHPFTLRLTETAPGETIACQLSARLAEVSLVMDFHDLPGGKCRVIGRATVTPKTVMVRLAMHSLRLAQGQAEDRLGRFIRALGRA